MLFGFLILFDLFCWFVGLGCFFGVCVWVFFPLGWLGIFLLEVLSNVVGQKYCFFLRTLSLQSVKLFCQKVNVNSQAMSLKPFQNFRQIQETKKC